MQHPIAPKPEAVVDAEITRMATEGINSPVLVVRKKNNNIRVVANKLKGMLVDLDLYPIPTIDSIFNKIGEGNK